MADDQSSIPSMVDGLTPVQRMILSCALKNPHFQEVKEFIGYVSERSADCYEKKNLVTTMTGMAQNDVGTNNINLLFPYGRDCIFTHTQLFSITRYIFHESDELLLEYLNEDGKFCAPTWLMPIIPMVLVNGSAEGICTKYNPRDIIANIRRLLNGEDLVPMDPWYKWFKGTILRITETFYTTFGVVRERKHQPNKLFISELPIGKSTEQYKEFLKAAALSRGGKKPFIEGYIAHHYGDNVTFEVVMSPDQMKKAREEGFENKFKLTTDLDTSNLRLLDVDGVIKKYRTPEEILVEFFPLRIEHYEKRKSALIHELHKAVLQVENKIRFVCEVLAKTIILHNRKPEELYADLKDKGYGAALPKEASIEDYQYLLSIKYPMCTEGYENQLRIERYAILAALDSFRRTCAEDLWLQDLGALEVQLEKEEKDEDEQEMRTKWIPVSDYETEEEEPSEASDSETEEEPSEEQDKDEDEPEMRMVSDSVSEEEEPSEVGDPGIEEEEPSEEQNEDETQWKSKRRRTMSLIDGDDEE